MRRAFFTLAAGTCFVGACAKGLLVEDAGGGGGDATIDGGGCPQFDTTNDPQHCGSCTNACEAAWCVKGCVPTGTRQPFDTLASSTASGCRQGNPCGSDTYSFAQTNGANFQAAGEKVVCGGTTACVGHVGINTYDSSTTVCQGTWDVYCDGTKVGSIATTGKTCAGTAMTNGCSTSFTPMSCSNVTVQLAAGSGVILCCDATGTTPDSMLVGVSAW